MGNIKSIKMKKQKALILIDLQNDYFEGGLYPLVGSLDAVYEPVIQRRNSVWYKSPFRAEKKASFKVDLHKELWYDFGLAMRVLIISFQCITCIAY